MVLIKRKGTVFDGIVHELIGNERETVLPWNVNIVLFEKIQHRIADNLRLLVIGEESDKKLKVPVVRDSLLEEGHEIRLVESGYVNAVHRGGKNVPGHTTLL